MSHYDDDYAFEAEQRRKAYRRQCLAALSALKAFRPELPGDTPKRFLDSLEDLENWINANKGSSK